MKDVIPPDAADMESLDDDPVISACREIFRIPYPFPWQRLIISAVLDATLPGGTCDGNDEREQEPLRRIAILPTGAGKSLCWMLPALLIEGLTIAVFPLLSLMADQKRRLDECGISSVVLRGAQKAEERRQIWKELANGKSKIILANPEVLQSPAVEKRLEILQPVFLAVDETHTVSQWGESFRPACAGLGRLVERWEPRAVLALTATAGPHMRRRITELLFNGHAPDEALADPDRPAIRYGVIPALSRNHALERLVREERRPLIVFGPTRSSVEMAARMLRRRLNDEEIRYYHAGLSPMEKSRLEGWFMDSDNGVLCATCAYGLGVDKKNIRSIVHLSPPSSTEAYLQESGRASRDGLGARAWLIWTPDDPADSDDPRKRSLTGTPDPQTIPADPAPVNSQPSTPSAEEVAAARRRGMIRYAVTTGRCRREMLLEALGIEARDCSGCDVCGGESWRTPPEEDLIMKFFRWNRRRFRKGQAARILIGRRTAEILRRGLDVIRGFGILSGWELEDAEEAIAVLMHAGYLKKGNRRIGKGRLDVVRSYGKAQKKGARSSLFQNERYKSTLFSR